jgi:hypothetical protein
MPLLRRSIIAAALPLLAFAHASAQLTQDRFGVGATLELYRFSDRDAIGIESLMLLTVPIAARVDPASGLSLTLGGAYARGALRRSDGSEATITGPTDTELRASYVIGDDAVTFTAIALLPTGQAQLDADEADVAGAIAADVLPFRITNWGTGGGFGASVALARSFGETSAGIGAGYVVAREFEPVDGNNAFVYRPGNQLHVTAAFDRTIQSASTFSLRLSFLGFATDQANGQNLYQTGNRIQATGSYAFASGPRANGLVYAGVLLRGEGDFAVSSQIIPAQNLVFAGAGWRLPFAGGLLQPGIDVRLFSGSDDAGSGYTLGAGLGAELPLGSASVAPSARVRYGSADAGGGAESGYVGAELSLAVRFGGR